MSETSKNEGIRKSVDENVKSTEKELHSEEKKSVNSSATKSSNIKKSSHKKKSKKDMSFIERFKYVFDHLSVSQVAICALTVAILVVAAVTLVVIFKTTKENNENLAKANEVVAADTTEDTTEDDTASVTEETAETVSPVEIPEMAEYTIKSQSTVKDLTLIFQGSDKKKIKGTEFKVKLVSEKSAKSLNSAIEDLKADNENLSALKTKQSEISSGTVSSDSTDTSSNSDSSNASESSKTKNASTKDSTKSDSSTASSKSSNDSTSEASESADSGSDMQSVNDEITKALSKREDDIKAYNKAFEALKGTTYTDKDKDGMIYIKSIDAGNYVAVCESTGNFVATSYTTKVAVKEKADYKPIAEIEEKVVSEKAAGDTKEEKPAVEAALTDTVEWVESSQDNSGAFEKTSAPSLAVAKSSGFNTAKGKYTGTPKSKGFFYRKGYLIAEGEVNAGGDAANVAVTGINLSASSSSIKVGESTTLTATVQPENATNKDVEWSSSDNSIATVSGGTVTGVKAGSATITAKAKGGNYSASCSITVTTATKPVESISLNKTTAEIAVGATDTLTATVTPSDATDATVTWTSSDNSVATVNNGTVSGVKAGTATITATAGGKSATCSVTVKDAASEEKDCSLSITDSATIYSSVNSSLNTVVLDVKMDPAGSVENLSVKSSSSNVTATYKDSKVTVTAKNGLTKAEKVTITLSGTTVGKGDAISVTSTVTVNGSNTELKASDGSTLYTDEKGSTVLTVGNYTSNVYKANGNIKYYGWQTLNGITYYYDKNGNRVTGEQVIKGAKYNFGSDGALLKSGNGIDVSKWQGNIDWNQVSGAVSFAVIRCGYRGTSGNLAIDPKYLKNIKGAKAAGVKVGIYFYSRATNEAEAIEEASLAVSLAQQGGGVSLPIYMDMEASNQKGLSSAQLTSIANAFISTVNNGGYRGGLYASKNWLAQRMNNGSGVSGSIWVAQYNTKCTYSGRKDIWQYTSSGTCPGISGRVDWNESYF